MVDETREAAAGQAGVQARVCAGLMVRAGNNKNDEAARAQLEAQWTHLGLNGRVCHSTLEQEAGRMHRFWLDLSGLPADLLAELDTAGLTRELTRHGSDEPASIEAEIWLGWLVSPLPMIFPDFEELQAQFRVRCDIVDIASRTLVDFHATAVNRPVSHWTYVEGIGFRLNPGKSLAEGLALALHPETPQARYAFSCYRASEYIVLLALAREAQRSNPSLYQAMERQWLREPLTAEDFEAAFLTRVGTQQEPAPRRWYVPGDRVWFRNPEPLSADVAGYEGSFVLYLGRGRFGNFWKQDQAFTVDGKLLEIYCWRFAIEPHEGEESTINDDLVDEHVANYRKTPLETARIVADMDRYRDPYPDQAGGGAIDYQREVPRFVLPVNCSVRLES